MIISENRKPSIKEFESLTNAANRLLNEDAKLREEYYMGRNAQKLEDDVLEALNKAAKGTAFENTITKISGQKFPDIVAAKYYGVEVKSSKDTSWTTLGGSVNESTRVEGVERIFLIFGKLVSPIEFKARPYEDCLSDVVVTHYPRYKINMGLDLGETIFDKMGISYEALRQLPNPVKRIVDFYKGQLKDGESLWWIDDSDTSATGTDMKVKLWRTLPPDEKKSFVIAAFAYFPEVFGNSQTKYERFSLWLASRYGIVSTSMRDSFSAGGQRDIITTSFAYTKMPQILHKVDVHKDDILAKLLSASEDELKDYWRQAKISDDRLGQWIDIVCTHCRLKNYSLKKVLNNIFARKP